MRDKFRRLLLLLGLLALPVPGMACDVRQRATVPLDITGGLIVVQVDVNGIAGRFILDTGAQRSTVTLAAVSRLALARDPWVSTTMQGVGGTEQRPNANPRSLAMGGVPLQRRTVTRDTSLTVMTLPFAAAASIDGLLGRDYLSVFDLDLDMRARRLTLYDVTGCSGRFLPWTGNYTPMQVENPANSALIIPVAVDGVKLRALLDTGASATLVAAPGMARLSLSQQQLAGDPADTVSGMGPRTLLMHRHRFNTLRVGDETTPEPLLWVAPTRLNPITDMLLGADWLAGKRLWISYATRQVFISGN